MARIGIIVLALLLRPDAALAQDAAGRARAECEAKLQLPRTPGSGDAVREAQIQQCVQEKLREQPQGSRQRR
jgi:hypothetical protein